MRWKNYVYRDGSGFDRFWENHLSGRTREVLFVLGLGFDARMCLGVERILNAGGDGRRDALLLCFNNNQEVPENQLGRIADNDAYITSLIASRGRVEHIPVRMRSDQGVSVASPETAAAILKAQYILKYDDIVVDISAAPRVIALTAIATLLSMVDKSHRQCAGSGPNVHVVVAESHVLDQKIIQDHLDEDTVLLKGFSGHLTAEASQGVPKILFPILGEGRGIRLQRIYARVQPDEICPVIPSPARNPRRGDQLIAEYREQLFDAYQVEPSNILYASEFNPFEAYRQIFTTVARYQMALEDLGGCKAFVSPLSSKLLSVGALLACYELRDAKYRVGIPYVEPRRYTIGDSFEDEGDTELNTMWLTGECYDA